MDTFTKLVIMEKLIKFREKLGIMYFSRLCESIENNLEKIYIDMMQELSRMAVKVKNLSSLAKIILQGVREISRISH